MNNNKIEMVICDWAGTTVDYGCFAPMDAFQKIFETKNISITNEEIAIPMGMGKRDHIRALMEMPNILAQWKALYGRRYTESDIDEMYAEFQDVLFEELVNFCEPISGVVETINKLKKKGIVIGSTSGYTSKMMEIVLNESRERGYEPDDLVTSEVVGLGRPYPYMIFENMRRHGITSVANVIKIGDTITDIKEGKNAGVISVGILEGSNLIGLDEESMNQLSEDERNQLFKAGKKKYFEAGADYVLTSISELPSLIQKIEEC